MTSRVELVMGAFLGVPSDLLLQLCPQAAQLGVSGSPESSMAYAYVRADYSLPTTQPIPITMSKMFDNLKSKIGGNKNEEEQQFSIQPHPAKTNDPADLQGDQPGGGLNSQHEPASAFHARGPYQPPSHITDNLEQPASRDELRARQAELNK